MGEQIRVIIIDDETLLVESLEIILSINTDIQIVGTANDGYEALKLLKLTHVDIALVDLNMTGMGGIELIKELKLHYPTIKILVLTTFYDRKNITSAIKNGANGYLLKDSGKNAIIDAIHNVIKGHSVLDGKVMEELSKIITQGSADDELYKTSYIKDKKFFRDLTKRELEICTMLADGYTNSQIASFLFISEGTVKNYMTSIYDKTDIHDRTLLAIKIAKLLVE